MKWCTASLRPTAMALAVVLSPGCQKSLPMAPSDLATGVIVYEHANFLGESAHITQNIANLSDFRGPCEHERSDESSRYDWNDCISSVRVAPGWSATLYRGTGFDDDSLRTSEDVANLTTAPHDCPRGGLNDCVSSIRVSRQ